MADEKTAGKAKHFATTPDEKTDEKTETEVKAEVDVKPEETEKPENPKEAEKPEEPAADDSDDTADKIRCDGCGEGTRGEGARRFRRNRQG